MLVHNEVLYPQDINLQNKLGVSERTLRRYLEDIHFIFSHIIVTEKIKTIYSARKVEGYRIVQETDYSHILKYFIENDSDTQWILQLILDNDPELLKNMSQNERSNLQRDLRSKKDNVMFVTLPFEEFTNQQKENFKKLKMAVQNHEYRTILYKYTGVETIIDAKCLKVLFISNNWYLAIETNNSLRLLRIAFVEKVSYSKKNRFHESTLEKYTDYFNSIQNAFTLCNTKKHKAILQVSPERAKYFLPKMKPFFKSQQFINQDKQGFLNISVEYTQSLEILPFIKQWIPHIKILEPDTLKTELKNEISDFLASFE